jgi:hypothetical protein
MIKNRPLVQGQEEFILHITDLVSATKKFEPNGLHGSPIEAFIEERAIGNENSLFNVCPFTNTAEPLCTLN